MDILVDSNIVVYAINDDSPKQARAQKFLNDERYTLFITHQNIMESLRVLTHPKFSSPMSVKAAMAAITAISDACTVIAPDPSAIYVALDLIKQHQSVGNQIFDAYLAATTLSAGLKTIATDNGRDFAGFEGLDVYNPFTKLPGQSGIS